VTVIKIDLQILKDLYVFSTSEYERVVFEIPVLYQYLRTFVTLTSERLDMFNSHFNFKNLSNTVSCPVNRNVMSLKIRTLQKGSNSKKTRKILNQFQQIMIIIALHEST
jgi:hypothetical protein